MWSDWMRKNEFCKDFSPIFISHDRHMFRILFYYAEWQEAYRKLQYDTREKALEEQSWGMKQY